MILLEDIFVALIKLILFISASVVVGRIIRIIYEFLCSIFVTLGRSIYRSYYFQYVLSFFYEPDTNQPISTTSGQNVRSNGNNEKRFTTTSNHSRESDSTGFNFRNQAASSSSNRTFTNIPRSHSNSDSSFLSHLKLKAYRSQCKQSLSTFSGGLIDPWLSEFYEWAGEFEVSDSDKILEASSLLTGEARAWHNSRAPFESWKQWVKLAQEKFSREKLHSKCTSSRSIKFLSIDISKYPNITPAIKKVGDSNHVGCSCVSHDDNPAFRTKKVTRLRNYLDSIDDTPGMVTLFGYHVSLCFNTSNFDDMISLDFLSSLGINRFDQSKRNHRMIEGDRDLCLGEISNLPLIINGVKRNITAVIFDDPDLEIVLGGTTISRFNIFFDRMSTFWCIQNRHKRKKYRGIFPILHTIPSEMTIYFRPLGDPLHHH